MADRSWLVVGLTLLAFWLTLFSTGIAGPFTPASAMSDLLCEGLTTNAKSIRWRSVFVPAGADDGWCAEDARARLARFVSIGTFGSDRQHVALALNLVAIGNALTVLFPRAAWIWALGLMMLRLAAWGVVFEAGYYVAVVAVILTLLAVSSEPSPPPPPQQQQQQRHG